MISKYLCILLILNFNLKSIMLSEEISPLTKDEAKEIKNNYIELFLYYHAHGKKNNSIYMPIILKYIEHYALLNLNINNRDIKNNKKNALLFLENIKKEFDNEGHAELKNIFPVYLKNILQLIEITKKDILEEATK